jgi:hypothetical protein
MGRFLRRAWVIAAAALLADLGCKNTAASRSYANDPLLISKKPVEGNAATIPVALNRREPTAPALPSDTMVVRAACPDEN